MSLDAREQARVIVELHPEDAVEFAEAALETARTPDREFRTAVVREVRALLAEARP